MIRPPAFLITFLRWPGYDSITPYRYCTFILPYFNYFKLGLAQIFTLPQARNEFDSKMEIRKADPPLILFFDLPVEHTPDLTMIRAGSTWILLPLWTVSRQRIPRYCSSWIRWHFSCFSLKFQDLLPFLACYAEKCGRFGVWWY